MDKTALDIKLPEIKLPQWMRGVDSNAQKRQDEAWRVLYGDKMLNSLAGGLGIGLGGTGLYYLYQGLANRQPPKLENDDEDEVKEDVKAFSPKTAAGEGAGDTVSNITTAVKERLGNMLPSSWLDFVPGASTRGPVDPNSTRAAFGNTAIIGAGGLGLLGGNYLINRLYENKKQKDREDEVADAANEYHAALMGHSKKSKDESLGKSLWDKGWGAISSLPGVPEISTAVQTPYVMTGAGLSALAAYLMYERARSQSAARSAISAEKSKARLAGTTPDYVDPSELKTLKQMAS